MLAKTTEVLRRRVHYDTIDSSLSLQDLAMVKLEYAAHLVPSLVTSDGKLRLRKQQHNHRNITSKAVVPYLRKVEKAAGQS